ncbi:hypothetical protein P4B35_02335 [Pontiellaceae bacterium B12227]|nr:hypothetical protein [Pontiellaceae bacterium B12227]
MNKTKVNRILEYIGIQSEFPFDVFDAEDEESVLGYYGIHPVLDDKERSEVRAGLLEMAGTAQTAEIARLMTVEPAPRGLYRCRYANRTTQSVGFGEWVESLPEKLRGGFGSRG